MEGRGRLVWLEKNIFVRQFDAWCIKEIRNSAC